MENTMNTTEKNAKTPEEKLAAYERMQAFVKSEYTALTEKMEKLKAEDKTKTVSYRESLGYRTYYKAVLELYEKFGL